MRVAYFINQYPAVSHTFIRREIQAIEGLGLTVVRYALWPGKDIVDIEDKDELQRTRYVPSAGFITVVGACLQAGITRPIAVLQMVRQALSLGWRSDRGLLRHLAYAIEALVLARWCKTDSIDHLHAHFGTNSTAIAMLAARISGVPYSFTAHGSEEFEKAPLLALKEKLERAKFAVCVSSYGRAQLMRWSDPKDWNKIFVVHCGLDDKFLDGPCLKPCASNRFVCVGRLGEHKAQLILLGAVRELQANGVDCEVRLVGDGPMRDQVEEAIRASGLATKVSITGWVSGDRVKEEMTNARALILPSFSENMPVVIMEAMALGRPVISTYVAGIPELIVPGRTGWLVPASDKAALANAMSEALAASLEELAKIGAMARARIVERHCVSQEARRLRALFESDWDDPSVRTY